MKPIRRWRYIIDWRPQVGTALQIVAVLAGICLICAVAVKFVKTDDALEDMGAVELRNFLYRVTAAQFVVSATTLGVLAIYLTHRFAGPAFAIERALRALVAGRTDQGLHLRERDYLKSIAGLVEDLRKGEEERAKLVSDARACLVEGDVAGAQELLSRLAAGPAARAAPAPAEPVPASAQAAQG